MDLPQGLVTTAVNLLFLMCDQMQGRLLDPDHPCLTPNLDRLAARGVRFTRAYTPNAICSPARASLMTGRLPHSHGVLTVIHTVDDDQCCLRTQLPHWAQRLQLAGYNTGYFGKWHVERSRQLTNFGWGDYACEGTERLREADAAASQQREQAEWLLQWNLDQPPGYQSSRFYGVTESPPEDRTLGVYTRLGLDFLDAAIARNEPWCCFVSVNEPHDPFICGAQAFAQYNVDAVELPANIGDDLAGRPGIYRKAARVWSQMTERQKREAAACYWASATEIDAQFGRLLDRVESAGQLENTIVVFTSDHGELLGAHGLYCKNFTAAEEVYNVPLLLAGPGVARGVNSDARVGLHDICPTVLELAGVKPFDTGGESRSFVGVAANPASAGTDWDHGYAEYFGGRMWLTQRVVWEGDWKFVFNGFDEDELYDLASDPGELTNRIADPQCEPMVRHLAQQMWQRCRDTNDDSLLNSGYPILRVAPIGPEA
ncbi:MAG: sulfatase-like hydrolase/transferase [Candidatus Latescibacterota bacterium]|nr:sulfatase-like hydrolase/transferase [Candidatus Latescibacterota bacterium]